MNDNKQSIEEAYQELQAIVKEFEGDEVNLEKSIPKFKRGLELAAKLKEKLNVLKNEVEEIKETFQDKEVLHEQEMPEPDDDSNDMPF